MYEYRVAVKFYADEISRIIEDCEYIQEGSDSRYTKETAKIHAYDSILELFKADDEYRE